MQFVINLSQDDSAGIETPSNL